MRGRMSDLEAKKTDSPANQAMQQTCEKCGITWTSDEFLPCPKCPPPMFGTCLNCDAQFELINTAGIDIYRKGYVAAMESAEVKGLVEALEFYSTMQNFTHCSQEGEPECADDEFPNWMSGEGEFDIEDGTVAKTALKAFRDRGVK